MLSVGILTAMRSPFLLLFLGSAVLLLLLRSFLVILFCSFIHYFLALFDSIPLTELRSFYLFGQNTSDFLISEHLNMGNLIWHKYSRLVSISSSVCELPPTSNIIYFMLS
jgi:hypothetical protein